MQPGRSSSPQNSGGGDSSPHERATTEQLATVSAPRPGRATVRPGALTSSAPGHRGLLSRTPPPVRAPGSGSAPSSVPPESPAEERGPGIFAPRKPTLTAQMRAVQPPDVARQALSELSLLAHELAALPEQLEISGLARTHRRSYFDATRSYLELAGQAWEAIAEERLEQSGAEPAYRQRAVMLARRLTHLQQECRVASGNADFQLPRRVPWLWRRRVALVRRGLRAWQEHLTATPDPLAIGRGLLALRGNLGLATGGAFALMTLDLLIASTIMLVALVGVGAALMLTGALVAGNALAATTLVVSVLSLGLVEMLVLLLAVNGPLPLGVVLGAAVYAPGRSTRNVHPGTALVAGLLRAWWLLVGGVAVLVLLLGLAIGGALLSLSGTVLSLSDAPETFALIGSPLITALGPAAAVSLTALLLIGFPALLVALCRAVAELADSPSWVPAARRYALEPTLAALAPVASVLLVGTWLAATVAGWQQVTLPSFGAGALTLRGVVLFLALALPYLLLLELPYRIGIWRWRRAWLSDLQVRRADVESHVRRLSAADPHTGTQDTSEENLRAMQYDLVLLQFYRDKIDESRRTPGAPFRLPGSLFALGVAIAGALLLDGVGTALAHLLLTAR